jgi:hypothetical protein
VVNMSNRCFVGIHTVTKNCDSHVYMCHTFVPLSNSADILDLVVKQLINFAPRLDACLGGNTILLLSS